MATYIILGMLALIVGAVMRSMVKNKRATGKAVSCSNCAGCSGCGPLQAHNRACPEQK